MCTGARACRSRGRIRTPGHEPMLWLVFLLSSPCGAVGHVLFGFLSVYPLYSTLFPSYIVIPTLNKTDPRLSGL